MMAQISHLPSGQIIISTKRLLLRGALESDVESMFRVLRDPEVMRYWSEAPHAGPPRTSKWISNMITNPLNGLTDFIICLKADEIPIGKMGIWQGHEIGFLLAREQWGKGIAREALQALLPYYYGQLEDGGRGLEKIMADADPRNEACIGFLKSFGFGVTGFEENTFEIDGQWADSTYLELTREKWEERNQPIEDARLMLVYK